MVGAGFQEYEMTIISKSDEDYERNYECQSNNATSCYSDDNDVNQNIDVANNDNSNNISHSLPCHGIRSNDVDGYWKDSLWSCFSLGCCHPTVWMGCCLPCAASQVAVRLRMTPNSFLGNSVTSALSSSFCGIRCRRKVPTSLPTSIMNAKIYLKVFRAVICIYTIRLLLFIIVYTLDPNVDRSANEFIQPSVSYYVVCGIDDILWLAYTIWTILLVYRVRVKTRQVYRIPDSRLCPRCCLCCCPCSMEDALYAALCPSLSVMQTLRQTANYNSERVVRCCCCISPTGLHEKEESSPIFCTERNEGNYDKKTRTNEASLSIVRRGFTNYEKTDDMIGDYDDCNHSSMQTQKRSIDN